MSRPIQLLGELPEQLRVLKETCEMEGSRSVSLRADELLGLVIVLTSSAAGLDVEILGDVASVDPAQLESQIAAAVASVQKQVDERDALLAEFKASMAEDFRRSADLREKSAELQRDLEASRNEVESLSNDRQELENLRTKEHDEHEAALAKLQADNAELETALKARGAEAVNVAIARGNLEAEVAVLKASKADLETKLAPFQAALAAAATLKPAAEPTEK